MAEIRTRHLFTMRLMAGTPQLAGTGAAGERRAVPVTGGSFEGERLRGRIGEGGSDWILVRPDGTFQLDVRLALCTDDGAIISMTYAGLRHGPADVMARMGRGEQVDASLYYFRTAIQFETGSEKYSWLNRIIAIGTGHRPPEGPVYDVFEVL